MPFIEFEVYVETDSKMDVFNGMPGNRHVLERMKGTWNERNKKCFSVDYEEAS